MRVKIPKALSKGEESLAQQLRIEGIKFERQYKFSPDRKYRADFALLGPRIILEVHGGLYSPKSGHRSYKGRLRDMEKSMEAQSLGWRYFEYSTEQVESGFALTHLLGVL